GVMFEQREQAGGADRQTSMAVDLPLDLFRRGPRVVAGERRLDRATASVRDRERLAAAAIREEYGTVLVERRRVDVMDAVVAASRRTHELLTNRVAEGA